MEQTLGHITHTANLARLLPHDERIDATILPIPFELGGWRRHLPWLRNWTVRAGWLARRSVGGRRTDFDALVVHTQVLAVGMTDILRRVPSVVSLDATPRQYDSLGEHYQHMIGSKPVERLKWQANRKCLRSASRVVSWAEWTRQGLIDDYDVAADAITVIAPGVDLEVWRRPSRTERGAVLRVLFVGGDLARKGGPELIEAVTEARRRGSAIELDVVTRDPVPDVPGVRGHHGLNPNDDALRELYRQANVFALPTRGDCLPMVLSEAGALGLPAVATDVGAIGEIVRDGETGLLVPLGDVPALTDALVRLAADEPLRRRLGEAARNNVIARFDAAANARRLVDVVLDAIASKRPARHR
ncbi:MAG: glycosyltransferase family 4 protein [Desertimonas sp.]